MAADAQWKVWLGAARPRTLPAAIAPVLVGSALAWRARGFDARAAGICLGFALLVQIGANFANDYYDFIRGADTAERRGPRRAVAAGLVTPAAMRRATWLTFLLALALGLVLVAWGGLWLVAVGIACVVSAVAYTGGPWPLGYLGLGDLFVFVFFGLVAVGGTFYVQAGRPTPEVWLAAAAVGLLTTNILLVNNYRDAETDRRAGKRTLVVRLGKPFARGQFAASHLGASGAVVALAYAGLYSPAIGWVAAGLLALLGFRQWRTLTLARDAGELIALLGRCGAHVALYALTVSALILTG